MKIGLRRLACACLCFIASEGLACGPSPQKVTEEIVIQASPDKVWQVMGDVLNMPRWHPLVSASEVGQALDDNQMPIKRYTLKLHAMNGLNADGAMVLKPRNMTTPLETNATALTLAQGYKLGTVMLSSDLPVSNYSDSLSLKVGSIPNQTIVTWVGRFGNQANAMQAPVGKDDAAAISSVTSFYKAGLNGLKQFVEGHP